MDSPNDFGAAHLDSRKIAGGAPLLKRLVGIKVSPILAGVAYSVLFQSVRIFVAWRAGHLRTVGATTGILDDPALYTNTPFLVAIWAYYIWMPKGIAAVFRELYVNRVIGSRHVHSLGAEPRRRLFRGPIAPVGRVFRPKAAGQAPESSNTAMPSQDSPASVDATLPTQCRDKRQEHSRASFVEEMQASFGGWWWSAVSLALSLGATVILIRPRYLALGQSAAWTADIPSRGLSLLWALIGLHCVLLLLIYSALGIYWLRRLFKSFTIRVRPLNPDRAGGLSPLGSFTLKLSYIIVWTGFILVVTPITRNYVAAGTLRFRWTVELVTGLGIYLIAAPVVFLGPLLVAHRVMEDAREQLLSQIARRFDMVWAKVQDGLSVDVGIPQLDSSLKALKELEALHEIASKFPVWPFNLPNLARFGATYVSPLVVAVATTWLTELLKP